ncbi:hypothetical protein NFX46_03520 [Streptomyces phaeoluteigriseus]|uniref:Amidohydrolase 3 domain-containing protein n=1 Tax=Streptomyces phaeoluteigriseus TaxID=114686 RepID=A0ABY4Z2M4_9ACTN|nr:hypothetical protein [Streptomyces phaeoluteigriseus]USQ82920.1 hypothetical protein NFX46_03520 [Streptomyces phaeoluteigriseus]
MREYCDSTAAAELGQRNWDCRGKGGGRRRKAPGPPADLPAARGNRPAGALSLAYSRIVIHRGRVVARTSAVREYCDSTAAAELGQRSWGCRGRGRGTPS